MEFLLKQDFLGTFIMYMVTIVVLGICFALWKLFGDDDDPLNKLPGPVGYPIFGSTFQQIHTTPRELFLLLRKFAKEYGDRYLVKGLGTRVLHIHNPNDVEIVLSHPRNIKKSKAYMFLQAWLGSGLLLSSGTTWHSRRKILTPTFHFNVLKSFINVMEERSRALVENLMKMNGTPVNLMTVITDVTLLIICETAMGTQLDADKYAESIQYKSSVTEMGPLLINRLNKIWFHNDFLFKKFSIGKKYEKCLHTVRTFADKVILERKKTRQAGEGNSNNEFLGNKSKNRLAMLDLLLEAESKGKINLEGIRDEVNTFMFEGHDTTAKALIFSLMLIADHEQVQERIYEELQKILGDSDRMLTMADLAKMTYLQAAIKETLRLYPSLPVIAREVTEEFMLGDLLVRKGVEIAVHIYDLHRRSDLYPNPEEFKPERFLSNEPIHPYAFVPFSAGPRNCIEHICIYPTVGLKPQEIHLLYNAGQTNAKGLYRAFLLSP